MRGVEWLDGVGLDAAHAHEAELGAYELERLADVPGLRVFGRWWATTVSASSPSRWRVCTLTTFRRSSTATPLRCAPATTAPRCSWSGRDHPGLAPRGDRPAEDLDALNHVLVESLRARRGPGMDDLYREQILETYKRPTTSGGGRRSRLRGHQPVLRRRHLIKLDDDGRVGEVSFEGKGCAISTAATSMLTDELQGMSRGGAHPTAQGVRARPPRHRHLGDAHEVRAARAEDRQERQPSLDHRRLERRGTAGDPSEASTAERARAPLVRIPSASAGGCGLITAKTAPCGSVTTANRPTFGISVGPNATLPPFSLTWSTVASVSSTLK